MVNTLWEIDGQDGVFNSRNVPIPTCFGSFTGYIQPELSKHRKHERQNMSSRSLHLCANSLFGCLKGVYWEWSGWKELKSDAELLASSLFSYSYYPTKQCSTMNWVHSSLHPVCQILDNLSLYFFCCANVSPCFHQLEQQLGEKSLFEYLPVEEMCPAEPCKSMSSFRSCRKLGCLQNCSSFILTW